MRPAPAHALVAAQMNEMVQSVNDVRASQGLSPLAEDGALADLALERSSDMLSRQYFSHNSPDGQNIYGLLRQRGVDYSVAAENLAWNNARDLHAIQLALESFMSSTYHRDNLLNPQFSQIGVGIATDGGKTLLTVVFKG